MRIISGRAGGIRLVAPSGMDVRPTEDRVKESMFSTLGDLSGLSVLDLFSGTGALGLEALSRGAASVTSVEKERLHCDCIRRNFEAVKKSMGCETNYFLVQSDVRQALLNLRRRERHFDIILADPPYETAPGEYGYRELILDENLVGMCNSGALLMLEHRTGMELPWAPEGPWENIKFKSFGIRTVSYGRLVQEGESHD